MDWYKNIISFFSSSRGRDVLLYLLFVAISAAFWAILTLGNSIQTHYKVKFTIEGIPQGTTLITDYPQYIDVSVKNNGYAFVRYMVGSTPEVSAKFSTYADGKGNLTITRQNLEELLRNAFGQNASIDTFSPDQLQLKYTTQPGKKVRIVVNSEITPALQYVINGKLQTMPAYVTVYASADKLAEINSVTTERIVRQNLKEQTIVKVAITKEADVKIIPDSVTIKIPVEALVSKEQEIAITVNNCPQTERLVVFPGTLKVSYLVPLSVYNSNSNKTPTIFVDYNDISKSSKKLPLHVSASNVFHSVSLPVDSVEFIME